MTEEETKVVNELRLMARATKAYVEQDSRSERRRFAVFDGAVLALKHAQEVFGDEG